MSRLLQIAHASFVLVVRLARERGTGPPGGAARRGLEGVDTDRGKVIAGGGAGDDGKPTSK